MQQNCWENTGQPDEMKFQNLCQRGQVIFHHNVPISQELLWKIFQLDLCYPVVLRSQNLHQSDLIEQSHNHHHLYNWQMQQANQNYALCSMFWWGDALYDHWLSHPKFSHLNVYVICHKNGDCAVKIFIEIVHMT